MAKSNQIHTIHRPNGWGNLNSGATKVSKIYDTKIEAQTAGRQTAINQKSEHFIHNIDGKIGFKNSYGNDPIKSKG